MREQIGRSIREKPIPRPTTQQAEENLILTISAQANEIQRLKNLMKMNQAQVQEFDPKLIH